MALLNELNITYAREFVRELEEAEARHMSKPLGQKGTVGARWKDLRELVQVAAFALPRYQRGMWMEDVPRRDYLQSRFAQHCLSKFVQKNPGAELDQPVAAAPAMPPLAKPTQEEKVKGCRALFEKLDSFSDGASSATRTVRPSSGECKVDDREQDVGSKHKGFKNIGRDCCWKNFITL